MTRLFQKVIVLQILKAFYNLTRPSLNVFLQIMGEGFYLFVIFPPMMFVSNWHSMKM